jgi:hypothetical protein
MRDFTGLTGPVSDLFPEVRFLPAHKIHALIDFGQDERWICTANDGIFLFDGTKFTPWRMRFPGT